MARYPRPQKDLALWATQHATIWQAAANIGLTGAQTALLGQKADAFDAALRQHVAAEAAARSARQKKDVTRAALRNLLTGLIGAIDTHAALTGDPSVYVRAHLDAPGAPHARPRPDTPRIADMRMNRAGKIELTIEATTGGSAVFEIERQAVGLDGHDGPWAFVAVTASKTHVDTGTPRAVRMVYYRVRTRLTNGKASEWTAPHGVPFGPVDVACGSAGERAA